MGYNFEHMDQLLDIFKSFLGKIKAVSYGECVLRFTVQKGKIVGWNEEVKHNYLSNITI